MHVASNMRQATAVFSVLNSPASGSVTISNHFAVMLDEGITLPCLGMYLHTIGMQLLVPYGRKSCLKLMFTTRLVGTIDVPFAESRNSPHVDAHALAP